MEYRKLITDRFETHVNENFKAFCKRHGLEQNEKHLISFFVDQDLVPGAQVMRYTILNEFEKMAIKGPKQKSLIVNHLADRFSISERTVWSILKNTKMAGKKSATFSEPIQ